MVEFAFVLTVALFVLVLGIQFALIGQAALAVTQLSYTVARYASVNPSYTQSDINNYWPTVVSPTINDSSKLTVTLQTACASPNPFGTPVTVSVNYNLSGKIFLPNPFLGVKLPAAVSSVQTAFCEGNN